MSMQGLGIGGASAAMPPVGMGLKRGAAPRGSAARPPPGAGAGGRSRGTANSAATAAAMVAIGRTEQQARARSESPAGITGSQGGYRSQGRSSSHTSTPTGIAESAMAPGANGGPRGPQTVSKEILVSATTQQKGKETTDQFLAKVTHLQLQGQRLGPEFGDAMQYVPAASVVYAYDNLLTSLIGLQFCKRLQMLYLQNNRLTSMTGIEAMVSLRVLHLGHNRLAKIEGLENCRQLEELHVSNQRPRPDDAGENGLEFCPNSIAAVAYTLRSLSSASNRLRDTGCLGMLQQVQTLDLSGNEFAQAIDVKDMLTGPDLTKVQLHGNPFALQERKYRTTVVLYAPSIEEIDGRSVLPQERDFVRRLEDQKRRLEAQRQMHDQRQRGNSGSPAAPPVASASMKSGGSSGGLHGPSSMMQDGIAA